MAVADAACGGDIVAIIGVVAVVVGLAVVVVQPFFPPSPPIGGALRRQLANAHCSVPWVFVALPCFGCLYVYMCVREFVRMCACMHVSLVYFGDTQSSNCQTQFRQTNKK